MGWLCRVLASVCFVTLGPDSDSATTLLPAVKADLSRLSSDTPSSSALCPCGVLSADNFADACGFPTDSEEPRTREAMVVGTSWQFSSEVPTDTEQPAKGARRGDWNSEGMPLTEGEVAGAACGVCCCSLGWGIGVLPSDADRAGFKPLPSLVTVTGTRAIFPSGSSMQRNA